MLHGEVQNLRGYLVDARVVPDEECGVAFLDHLGEHTGECVRLLKLDVADSDTELFGSVVGRLPIDGEDPRRPCTPSENSNARKSRHKLLEHLETLAHHLGSVALHAGDVPSGPSQARDDAGRDQVSRGQGDDGNAPGRFLDHRGSGPADKDDDIDFDADEFLGRLLKAGQVVCWAALEDDVLPLDPPEAPQSLNECWPGTLLAAPRPNAMSPGCLPSCGRGTCAG